MAKGSGMVQLCFADVYQKEQIRCVAVTLIIITICLWESKQILLWLK